MDKRWHKKGLRLSTYDDTGENVNDQRELHSQHFRTLAHDQTESRKRMRNEWASGQHCIPLWSGAFNSSSAICIQPWFCDGRQINVLEKIS